MLRIVSLDTPTLRPLSLHYHRLRGVYDKGPPSVIIDFNEGKKAIKPLLKAFAFYVNVLESITRRKR